MAGGTHTGASALEFLPSRITMASLCEAGRVLDEALETAGIGRDDTYVTNVVKHFKWEPQGKRRKHKRLLHV